MSSQWVRVVWALLVAVGSSRGQPTPGSCPPGTIDPVTQRRREEEQRRRWEEELGQRFRRLAPSGFAQERDELLRELRPARRVPGFIEQARDKEIEVREATLRQMRERASRLAPGEIAGEREKIEALRAEVPTAEGREGLDAVLDAIDSRETGLLLDAWLNGGSPARGRLDELARRREERLAALLDTPVGRAILVLPGDGGPERVLPGDPDASSRVVGWDRDGDQIPDLLPGPRPGEVQPVRDPIQLVARLLRILEGLGADPGPGPHEYESLLGRVRRAAWRAAGRPDLEGFSTKLGSR